jgi:hypothetical protein
MSKSAKELLDEWMRLKDEYNRTLAQYVSIGVPPTGRPRKALTQEALEDLKALADAVEAAHDAWLDALRSKDEKSA